MELLETYIKEDKVFEKTIRFLCDKMILTNISSKKIYKELDIEVNREIKDFNDFIDFLLTEVNGKDVSIAIIQNYVSTFEDEETKDFIIKIATKKLITGVNSSTLNKVLKSMGLESLFEFKVQLAEAFNKVKIKELIKDEHWLGYFYITLKLDGVRTSVMKENNTVKFLSRSGNEYLDVLDLEKEFLSDKYPDNTFYDGEVVAINHHNYNATKLFSITNSIMKSKKDKVDVEYFMFDTMPIEEFKQGKSLLKYSERRKVLDSYEESEHIKILPVLYEGTDVSMIEKLSEEEIEKGNEGIMINKDAVYEAKRVKSLLKVKDVIHCDGIILDVYEGVDNNKGNLGGLIMSYQYLKLNKEEKRTEVIELEVKVGGGFSDEDKKNIWENPQDYIGKLAEYIITSVSEDRFGNKNVRFARFVRLRDDKDEESYEQ